MPRPYGEKSPDGLWQIPAAERNKGPILDVLREFLSASGLILEVASGTGQHVVHFASALPGLTWQPTDPDPEFRDSIAARIQSAERENVRDPLDLDVLKSPWPVTRVEGIVCINMIHVAPWEAARALLKGAGELLAHGGTIVLYGPYRRFGAHTAPSNEAFDTRLRAQNPDWGIRDLEDVEELASLAGLVLKEIIDMPANNLSLVFRARPRTGKLTR